MLATSKAPLKSSALQPKNAVHRLLFCRTEFLLHPEESASSFGSLLYRWCHPWFNRNPHRQIYVFRLVWHHPLWRAGDQPRHPTVIVHWKPLLRKMTSFNYLDYCSRRTFLRAIVDVLGPVLLAFWRTPCPGSRFQSIADPCLADESGPIATWPRQAGRCLGSSSQKKWSRTSHSHWPSLWPPLPYCRRWLRGTHFHCLRHWTQSSWFGTVRVNFELARCCDFCRTGLLLFLVMIWLWREECFQCTLLNQVGHQPRYSPLHLCRSPLADSCTHLSAPPQCNLHHCLRPGGLKAPLRHPPPPPHSLLLLPHRHFLPPHWWRRCWVDDDLKTGRQLHG